MAVKFKFKEEKSGLFRKIRRPVAKVLLKHNKENLWQPVDMLVDTGADYTLLPNYMAHFLGINLLKDCRVIDTRGVGGSSKVYFVKKKVAARLGSYNRMVLLGILQNNSIPPILGRHEFFETFKVTFEKFTVTFE